MSRTIRQLGITSGAIASWNHISLNAPDGKLILIVPDLNGAGVAAPYGDQTGVPKVHIYDSTDRINFTLRASIAQSQLGSIGNVFGNVAPNGDIGIALVLNDGSIRFIRLTSAYAVTVNEQAVAVNGTWDWRFVHISFTDANVPMIACQANSAAGGLQSRLWTRRTDTNVWIQSFSNEVHADGAERAFEGYSFIILKGGAAATRNIAYVIGRGRGADQGVELYTAVVSETTGASTGPTKRATYNEGDVSNKKYDRARVIQLFASGTNEFTYAAIRWYPTGKNTVARGTFDGATFTQTVNPSSANYSHTQATGRDVAISYGERAGKEAVNFFFLRREEERDRVVNITRRILADQSVTTRAYTVFDEWSAEGEVIGMSAGPGQNVGSACHDLLIYRSTPGGTRFTAEYVGAINPTAPASAGPAGIVNTATPVLKGYADLNRKWGQSLYKMRWRVSRTINFLTDLREFEAPDSQYRLVNNTDQTGTTVPFEYKVPDAEALPGGDWYLQASHIDEFGNDPLWTAAVLMDIYHPPTATDLTPDFPDRQNFGTGVKQLAWKLSDAFVSDVQTAYQYVVTNAYTGTVLFDSGKVASATPGASLVVNALWKNIKLNWTVRLWDASDDVGPYAPVAALTYSDGPVIAITDPGAGAVTTARPRVTFTATSPISTRTKKVRATFRKAGAVIFTTGTVGVDVADGTPILLSSQSSLLRDGETYTVEVYAEDEFGLNSTASKNFTTAWPKPAMPPIVTINSSAYMLDSGGYVRLTWDDSTQDANFIGWYIERKVDEVNANTGAITLPGVWTELVSLYQDDETFIFDDSTAPSNAIVTYRVYQMASTMGDVVMSDPRTTPSTLLGSSGYWLVEEFNELDPPLSIKLTSVTSDDYTDEYEEAELHLMGRGLRVERGDHLGVRGSLMVQLRDSVDMTARLKRQKLMLIKDGGRRLYLRTPFGDVYPVSVGNMQVGRIAGVGVAEFCDVTVPYAQVYK